MNHSELNKLWKKQREQYDAWRIELTKNSRILRDKIEDILKPPQKRWEDKNQSKNFRYIELVDITKDNKPCGNILSPESFTAQGELIFGIGITFDYGTESYPKKNSYIPVAIRFVDSHPEYTFFNTETWECQKWERSIDVFCKTIILKITDHLKVNPFDGPQEKSTIGFIN